MEERQVKQYYSPTISKGLRMFLIGVAIIVDTLQVVLILTDEFFAIGELISIILSILAFILFWSIFRIKGVSYVSAKKTKNTAGKMKASLKVVLPKAAEFFPVVDWVPWTTISIIYTLKLVAIQDQEFADEQARQQAGQDALSGSIRAGTRLAMRNKGFGKVVGRAGAVVGGAAGEFVGGPAGAKIGAQVGEKIAPTVVDQATQNRQSRTTNSSYMSNRQQKINNQREEKKNRNSDKMKAGAKMLSDTPEGQGFAREGGAVVGGVAGGFIAGPGGAEAGAKIGSAVAPVAAKLYANKK